MSLAVDSLVAPRQPTGCSNAWSRQSYRAQLLSQQYGDADMLCRAWLDHLSTQSGTDESHLLQSTVVIEYNELCKRSVLNHSSHAIRGLDTSIPSRR